MEKSKFDSILQACACANLRTVSRSLTKLYNQLLQPTGLKITQYYMLVNIYQYKKLSISELSDVMMLDQTTATRNVNVLIRNKFVHVEKDEHDSRSKCVFLTSIGLKKLYEATPIWMKVQEKIENEIGTDNYQYLLRTLTQVQHIISHYD
ncbi:MarR family winged helix-turn-helix transcriptional regulator [Pseudogracilibacillus sp. SO30301A]|uniref:MarR family winged helix-turn-helix transcriptional regulator n=1 Tax=Pseudogracilibacillus sp. SO30301A TaxID=3098291 RepID=UPI00300DE177